MLAILDSKDVSGPQKYRVLEDHFRTVIAEELEEVAEKAKADQYMKEFISGIRLAQSQITSIKV